MARIRAQDAAAQRRPKDRKAQIARASVDAFSAQGYHAVSMEDIAARVGISSAALYRHSASKYDLFRAAVLALGQELVDVTAFADDADDGDPSASLTTLIGALVDVTVANRTAGGLYRWEGRYLDESDQAILKGYLERVNQRLQRPLARLRPGLTASELSTLSVAALSVIGSITDHSAALAIGEVRSCVAQLAADVLAAQLPANCVGPAVSRRPPVTAAAGTYEFVLQEAMRLFYERGFRDTSIEDIAAAVAMQPSGLYRYFPAKADILISAYRRAADRISGDVARIVAETSDPGEALVELIDAYVARSFAHPEFANVYFTDRYHLPAQELLMIDTIQLSTADAWVRLVTAARSGSTPGRARYAVHAAFALIVDLGRLARYDNTATAAETARRLTRITLLGHTPQKPWRQ